MASTAAAAAAASAAAAAFDSPSLLARTQAVSLQAARRGAAREGFPFVLLAGGGSPPLLLRAAALNTVRLLHRAHLCVCLCSRRRGRAGRLFRRRAGTRPACWAAPPAVPTVIIRIVANGITQVPPRQGSPRLPNFTRLRTAGLTDRLEIALRTARMWVWPHARAEAACMSAAGKKTERTAQRTADGHCLAPSSL